jgi:glycosyltransferase involved in cell wall biosynthesis
MKVLWVSRYLENCENGLPGSWLQALYKKNIELNNFEIGNIAHVDVKKITIKNDLNLKQWLLPSDNHIKNNIELKSYYLEVINQFKPDVIHIWGTENLLPSQIFELKLDIPIILEIQGLIHPISNYVYSGLSLIDLFKTIGLKEILTSRTIFQIKNSFLKFLPKETNMIRNSKFISAPSSWMKAYVNHYNKNATIFDNQLPLRNKIILSPKWKYTNNFNILISSAYSSSFKGFHIAIKALAHLKNDFPDIKLKIVGPHLQKGIRRDGYINFVKKLINDYNLNENVIWLGSLNEQNLANEIRISSLVLLPSYIESYGVMQAESMFIGTPCVCSYNGGSSYLATDNESALFFPPGDYIYCAYLMKKLLMDQSLSEYISTNSINLAAQRNDTSIIYNKQIEIYKKVLFLNSKNE